MLGAGTQAEPFLVGNIPDFREAVAQDNAYVKLTNDIDCNKENYLEWQSLISKCTEIDFDGHAIINPLIATYNFMLDGNYKTMLRNGKILNIYENGANAIIKSCALSNMAVSSHLVKTIDTAFQGIVADRCNFVTFNQDLNNKAWFSVAQSIAGINSFKNCRFRLDGNIDDDSVFDSWNSNTGNLVADGCLFEGKINVNYATGGLPYVIYGGIINCVWAVDTLNNTGDTVRLAGSANNTNIYQYDISGLNNHLDAIPCNAEQIRNPDYLNSVGFTVVEV